MTDRAAGERLKRAIHVARARANILYDTDLATRSRVSYDTLMNWYGGKTVPRGAELRKVGLVLGVAYADLMAAYEGRDPEPQPLQEAMRDQTEAIRDLIEAIRSTLPPPPDPIVERAREAWPEAETSLEQARSTTPRRRSGHERRSEAREPAAREGEAS